MIEEKLNEAEMFFLKHSDIVISKRLVIALGLVLSNVLQSFIENEVYTEDGLYRVMTDRKMLIQSFMHNKEVKKCMDTLAEKGFLTFTYEKGIYLYTLNEDRIMEAFTVSDEFIEGKVTSSEFVSSFFGV